MSCGSFKQESIGVLTCHSHWFNVNANIHSFVYTSTPTPTHLKTSQFNNNKKTFSLKWSYCVSIIVVVMRILETSRVCNSGAKIGLMTVSCVSAFGTGSIYSDTSETK